MDAFTKTTRAISMAEEKMSNAHWVKPQKDIQMICLTKEDLDKIIEGHPYVIDRGDNFQETWVVYDRLWNKQLT